MKPARLRSRSLSDCHAVSLTFGWGAGDNVWRFLMSSIFPTYMYCTSLDACSPRRVAFVIPPLSYRFPVSPFLMIKQVHFVLLYLIGQICANLSTLGSDCVGRLGKAGLVLMWTHHFIVQPWAQYLSLDASDIIGVPAHADRSLPFLISCCPLTSRFPSSSPFPFETNSNRFLVDLCASSSSSSCLSRVLRFCRCRYLGRLLLRVRLAVLTLP